MAIPSVNLFSNQPGGPLTTYRKSINALRNAELENEMQKLKNQYYPFVTQAQAASQLAYANAVAPQFLAKLLANNPALANLSEDQKKQALQQIYNVGTSQNPLLNSLSQISAPEENKGFTGVGQPSTNSFSNRIKNAYNAFIGNPAQNQPPVNALLNTMNNQAMRQPQMQTPTNIMQQPEQNTLNAPVSAPKGAVSKLGEQWYDKNGNPVYAEEEIKGVKNPVDITVSEGNPSKTYAEKAGEFEGVVKQGSEQGKYRAQDLKNIGEDQLALSKSGVVLDRLTNIIKDPEFQSLRDTIPFFQDKQLSLLKGTGTKAQQEIIGDFISTAEAYKAATVNSFRGKALVREFDLADKIKISEKDTIGVAEGKLRSLKALTEIAQAKNNIISNLISENHMNLSDAVKVANKMIDTKGIGNEVNKSLERKISVTNNKTGETREMTVSEARKLGVPNV